MRDGKPLKEFGNIELAILASYNFGPGLQIQNMDDGETADVSEWRMRLVLAQAR